MDTFLISLKTQGLFIGTLVTIQTSIAVWFSVEIMPEKTTQLERGRISDHPVIYNVCSSPPTPLLISFLTLFITVCVVTMIISFKARKLPTNYNEVTYTYFTMFTINLIIGAFLCVYFTNVSSTIEPSFSTAIVTLISTYTIIFFLFSNKVYILYLNPHKNEVHKLPESPTIKRARYRRESTRLVPSMSAREVVMSPNQFKKNDMH